MTLKSSAYGCTSLDKDRLLLRLRVKHVCVHVHVHVQGLLLQQLFCESSVHCLLYVRIVYLLQVYRGPRYVCMYMYMYKTFFSIPKTVRFCEASVHCLLLQEYNRNVCGRVTCTCTCTCACPICEVTTMDVHVHVHACSVMYYYTIPSTYTCTCLWI